MTVYDLFHGYQPFSPPGFIPAWVEGNLRRGFLPTSRAMKRGLIKRSVQLQGKTIEDWQASPEPIKSLASEVVENLSEAVQKIRSKLGQVPMFTPFFPCFPKN